MKAFAIVARKMQYWAEKYWEQQWLISELEKDRATMIRLDIND